MSWLARAWSWVAGHAKALAFAIAGAALFLWHLADRRAKREKARADASEAREGGALRSGERERRAGERDRAIEEAARAERERIVAEAAKAEEAARLERERLMAERAAADERARAEFERSGSAAAEAKRRMLERERPPGGDPPTSRRSVR